MLKKFSGIVDVIDNLNPFKVWWKLWNHINVLKFKTIHFLFSMWSLWSSLMILLNRWNYKLVFVELHRFIESLKNVAIFLNYNKLELILSFFSTRLKSVVFILFKDQIVVLIRLQQKSCKFFKCCLFFGFWVFHKLKYKQTT